MFIVDDFKNYSFSEVNDCYYFWADCMDINLANKYYRNNILGTENTNVFSLDNIGANGIEIYIKINKAGDILSYNLNAINNKDDNVYTVETNDLPYRELYNETIQLVNRCLKEANGPENEKYNHDILYRVIDAYSRTPYDVATIIDDFMQSYDPYDYADRVDDRKASVEEIENMLVSGNIESIINTINEIIDDNVDSNISDQARDILGLMDKFYAKHSIENPTDTQNHGFIKEIDYSNLNIVFSKDGVDELITYQELVNIAHTYDVFAKIEYLRENYPNLILEKQISYANELLDMENKYDYTESEALEELITRHKDIIAAKDDYGSAYKLAVDIDVFMYSLDVPGFNDDVKDRNLHMNELTYDIYTGEYKYIIESLNEIVEEGGAAQETIEKAKAYIEKLEVFTPSCEYEQKNLKNINTR